MVTIKTSDEIEIMAAAGKLLAEVLQILQGSVREGLTTQELDRQALALIRERNCAPAFLGYKPSGAKKGYPATICASVNEGVVHGLPSERPLQKGDVLKIDIGLIHKDFYSDCAITIAIGDMPPAVQKLISTTKRALQAGIDQARPGKTLGDIGWAIQSEVRKNNFSIVEGLTGHGIGRRLHEDPYVLNFGTSGEGEVLEEGMVLAIEPMVSMKSGRVKQLPDDSFVTADGSFAAHFEHTIAITKNGPWILTAF